MKKYSYILIICLLLACKREPEPTIVEGTVSDETGLGIAEVKVSVYKLTDNFTANYYELIQSTLSDNNGNFRMVLEKDGEIVKVRKTGFFDPLQEQRAITLNTKNKYEIELNTGCRVNFHLLNPNNLAEVCVSAIFAQAYDCDFTYASECFDSISSITTGCFLWGGDFNKIEYWNNSQGYVLNKRDTLIFCPKGGTIDFTITY